MPVTPCGPPQTSDRTTPMVSGREGGVEEGGGGLCFCLAKEAELTPSG